MTEQPSTKDEAATRVYCSFCGYDQFERQKMIAGPTVFICDSCVRLCVGVLRAESVPYLPEPDVPSEPSTPDASLLRELVDCLTEARKDIAERLVFWSANEIPNMYFCGPIPPDAKWHHCAACNAATAAITLPLLHSYNCLLNRIDTALSRARKGLGA